MDRMIKLRDLLAYLDDEETIQVGVTGENEWSEYTEIRASSSLLTPFFEWSITEMGAEESYGENNAVPVIRVMIRRPDQEAKA